MLLAGSLDSLDTAHGNNRLAWSASNSMEVPGAVMAEDVPLQPSGIAVNYS